MGAESRWAVGTVMMRADVVSSALRSVGYDREARVLEVQFVSGTVYRYADVPADVHEALMSAPSHGRYFHQAVRDRFAYRRVG